jgi:uncharacterized phage-associated protein
MEIEDQCVACVAFRFDADKAVAAVTILASSDLPELTKGKICKLLFLIDHLHVVRYGRPVTGDWFAALPHGPVPSETLTALDVVETGAEARTEIARKLFAVLSVDSRYEYPRFWTAAPVEVDSLSRSDLKVIDEIVRIYGHMTFRQLRALTHEFDAYKTAWQRKPSSRMAFEEFFGDEEPEAIRGVKEQMIENAALSEALSGNHH